MRTFLFLALLGASVSAAGCHLHGAKSSVDGAALGRVVIYRNGVAFYERRALAHDGHVTIRVPRDSVDDFLKSLTVVDPATRRPVAVSIPRKEDGGGGTLAMTLDTPDHPDAEVLMTYVTEAPAWKPSYRVVIGDDGKVMLEGWAIVDNVTGEDWKGVLVGVGASSALAFRYDLWSVRHVDRDLLAGEEKFAIAPPTGVSPYAQGVDVEEVSDLAADELGTSFSGASSLENQYSVEGATTTAAAAAGGGELTGTLTDAATGAPVPGATVMVDSGQVGISDASGAYRLSGIPAGTHTLSWYYADVSGERGGVRVTGGQTTPLALAIRTESGGGHGEVIRISGTTPTIDATSVKQGITFSSDYVKNVPAGRSFGAVLGAAAGSQADAAGLSRQQQDIAKAADAKLAASVAKLVHDKRDIVLEIHGADAAEASARGRALRDKLVDDGLAASRIHVSTKVSAGESPRVRLLAVAAGAAAEIAPAASPAARGPESDAPVGDSRFMADRPMTVPAGSSAMVAMVHGPTAGGVVYLYDPVSDRGDARYAFRAVEIANPTADTLEPGPVTVYGDGRFIGEGLTEAVPPRASVVVPFALDKQIVVDRETSDDEHIAQLVTVQRGVVTAELQHRRTTTLTLTSRLPATTRVFLRKPREAGWTVTDAPAHSLRVGDSDLYEIELAPGAHQKVVIAQAMPLTRTLSLSSDAALDMMKVYIDEPSAPPALVEQIRAMLVTHRAAVDLVDRIATLRDELSDYKAREGELHAQLVTLKAVRTGGDLMTALRGRLSEISERVQKATLALVDAQEQLMLSRVKFGNQLADLHLTDQLSAR